MYRIAIVTHDHSHNINKKICGIDFLTSTFTLIDMDKYLLPNKDTVF